MGKSRRKTVRTKIRLESVPPTTWVPVKKSKRTKDKLREEVLTELDEWIQRGD